MSFHRKYQLILWLLPFFVVRGVLPAGFMIDTSHGRVSMVACHGYVANPAEAGQDDNQNHGKSVCPFAVAGVSGPAQSALSAQLVAVTAADNVSRYHVTFHSPFGPSRAQQSRAPPYFS